MTASRGADWSKQVFVLRLLMMLMVGAALSAAGPARADAQSACLKPTDVEMVQLLNRWRAEFTSGNAERLAALYADDATLVATKEGAPVKGKDAIRSYYSDLLGRHPKISITPSTLTAACNSAVISGPVVYRFKGERKGTRALLGGRCTTEFALQNGTWQIVRQSLAADPRSIGDPIDRVSPPL